MKTKFVLSLAALAVSTLLSGQAQASLLGSTVDTQYYAYGSPYNNGGSPATFVANGTVQNIFSNYYALTVSDHQIQYEFLSDTTWSPSGVSLNSNGLFITNGNLLTFSGAPNILNVTLDAASTFKSNFNLNNITFNAHSVAVDWQQVYFHQGDKVIIDVNPVPEPETYALMGLGLVGLLAARRRKQKQSDQ